MTISTGFYLQRAVVGAGEDAEAVELEAGDDVVVVAAQDGGLGQGAGAPVARHIVVDEEGALVRVEGLQVLVERGLDELEQGLAAEQGALADRVVEVGQGGGEDGFGAACFVASAAGGGDVLNTFILLLCCVC